MVAETMYIIPIGAFLENYCLKRLIEQQEWGPVFLAQAKTTGTLYAIHFLLPMLEQPYPTTRTRQFSLQRFRTEASWISTLQHPHILPLLDYGDYRGTPYLVYPYTPRLCLRTWLMQTTALTPFLVDRYLYQIACALEYAHTRGILHGNLSTKCIFMPGNQHLVVAEFGLMHLVALSRQEVQTIPAKSRECSYSGSMESCAPEQLLSQPVGSYTDVYALGAVLYRILTGHSPFSGKTYEEIRSSHLSTPVPPVGIWRTDLPMEYDQLLAQAMAKEPGQRYPSPNALASAYHHLSASTHSQQQLSDDKRGIWAYLKTVAKIPARGHVG